MNTFSYIEGSIWIMKQVSFKAKSNTGKRRMTPGEYTIFNDLSFDLKSNGDIRQNVKYLKLPENFKFAYKTINKLFNSGIQIDYTGAAWQEFLTAQKLRNRLTHPRNLSDLEINDNEIQICRNVCYRHNDLNHQCMKAFLATSSK